MHFADGAETLESDRVAIRGGCAIASAVLVLASGCGAPDEHADRWVVKQTPEEHHLWDTEDPGAAMAPTAVLVVVAVVCVGAALHHLRSKRRTSRRFRLPTARRALILARNRRWFAAVRASSQHQPSENAFIETIQRIANDGASYSTRQLPAAPGLYHARVRMGTDAEAVTVVVDAASRDIVAAHAGHRPGAQDDGAPATEFQRHIGELLERARAALPDAAEAFATRSPQHPDSIGTLACWQELMDAGDYEVALYALAEIAHGSDAGPACWAALEAAAQTMSFDAQQRGRALLPSHSR